MEMFLSKTAEKQFDRIMDYLEKNWNHSVAQDFYNRYLDTLDSIASFPFSCPESLRKKGMRLARITKHNGLYYKVFSDHIRIYFIWDTRKKNYKR